jgi:hypothetical protein
MSTDLFERLSNAIDKYELGSYDEQDFHSTLESIIQSISESHLNDLGTFLRNMEAELERTDFMVNEADRRDEYLKIIKQIKAHVAL